MNKDKYDMVQVLRPKPTPEELARRRLMARWHKSLRKILSLLGTASRDLGRLDRVDALDMMRLAQKELCELQIKIRETLP